MSSCVLRYPVPLSGTAASQPARLGCSASSTLSFSVISWPVKTRRQIDLAHRDASLPGGKKKGEMGAEKRWEIKGDSVSPLLSRGAILVRSRPRISFVPFVVAIPLLLLLLRTTTTEYSVRLCRTETGGMAATVHKIVPGYINKKNI